MDEWEVNPDFISSVQNKKIFLIKWERKKLISLKKRTN